MITRPTLRDYGGKRNIAPWVISYFPPRIKYVEPCGGAAPVLLQKESANLETYNVISKGPDRFFQDFERPSVNSFGDTLGTHYRRGQTLGLTRSPPNR